MIKFVEVEYAKEIVFSLPSCLVEGNLRLIKMLCHYVSTDASDTDLLRILEFSFHRKTEEIVFIANKEGISFLPMDMFHK